jgi:hypothetical protein
MNSQRRITIILLCSGRDEELIAARDFQVYGETLLAFLGCKLRCHCRELSLSFLAETGRSSILQGSVRCVKADVFLGLPQQNGELLPAHFSF